MDYVLLLIQQVIQMAVDALTKLKLKTSEEFLKLLCQAKKGYRVDYEFILEEISFIELIQNKELDDKLSLTTLQYYLNNQWQIVQS